MLSKIGGDLEQILTSGQGTYGAAIYHFETNEHYFHDADEKFYAASIIKVPIMAAVYEQVAKGTVSLSEKMVVRYEDMVGGSGILQNLSPGIDMSIYDLIMLMIIESDNTATNMLIDRIGTANIQQSMRHFGLQDSEFYNKLMVIPAKVEGYNMLTAREMTHLLKMIGDGKIVSWHACNEMVKIMKQQKFRDNLPSLLPAQQGPVGALLSWEVANKTGWITGAEHDIGLLYFPRNTFAVSVFGKEFASRAEAKRVIGEVARRLYDEVVKA